MITTWPQVKCYFQLFQESSKMGIPTVSLEIQMVIIMLYLNRVKKNVKLNQKELNKTKKIYKFHEFKKILFNFTFFFTSLTKPMLPVGKYLTNVTLPMPSAYSWFLNDSLLQFLALHAHRKLHNKGKV